MNGAVQEMVDLLQIEQIEENLFRAQNGPGNHVFGGQVLGQAIVADEWLLFSKESPTAARARGFVRGHVFNRDGELVASASQECLIRLREREHSVAG